MILGPHESYELLLQTGKLPSTMPIEKRRRIQEGKMILPLPEPLSVKQSLLAQSSSIEEEEIRSLESLGLFKKKFTLFVTDKKQRAYTKYSSCCYFSKALMPRSVLHVLDEIHILSPTLCALLLARDRRITDEQFLFAASQLCSRYAYSMTPERNLIERIPLTNKESFTKMLKAYDGEGELRSAKGSVRFKQLLPCVLENARSPMEIALGILLNSLKYKAGEELPGFEVNKEISLTPQEQRELSKAFIEVDFLWKKQGVILEYNGGVHAFQKEPDSLRANVLRDKGYQLEILTNAILMNFNSFMKFMKRMEEPLNMRLDMSANAMLRNRMLHSHIMEISRQSCRLISQ